jgi:serine/threonine protein phosphatase PrpC
MTIQELTLNKINRSLNSKLSVPSNIVGYCFDQYQGQRDYNEDRVLCSTNLKILNKIYHIFAVFDGHGGYTTS